MRQVDCLRGKCPRTYLSFSLGRTYLFVSLINTKIGHEMNSTYVILMVMVGGKKHNLFLPNLRGWGWGWCRWPF